MPASSSYCLHVQRATRYSPAPTTAQLKNWAKTVLLPLTLQAEITLRIVDIAEMTQLNEYYRHKEGATNVLSFPIDAPPLIGDIVFCADIIDREAREQDKLLDAHWAHLLIHGILHLLGYNHEDDHDAALMEKKEISLMALLSFPNPYQTSKD